MAELDTEPRRQAMSFALLAPNPHNRQPWLVDLSEPAVVAHYADPDRLLPHTDPMSRQITICLGCFPETMRIAASLGVDDVKITPFPMGENPNGIDSRPVPRAVFRAGATVAPDPLFAQIPDQSLMKDPFDTACSVPADALRGLSADKHGTVAGGSVADTDIAKLRGLTHDALPVEIDTPRTCKETFDLFRIGRDEVDANPDGIDFTGPLFEILAATGLMARKSVMDPTSQACKAGLDTVDADTNIAMGMSGWSVPPTRVWTRSQPGSIMCGLTLRRPDVGYASSHRAKPRRNTRTWQRITPPSPRALPRRAARCKCWRGSVTLICRSPARAGHWTPGS
jgi:hypothetical protein